MAKGMESGFQQASKREALVTVIYYWAEALVNYYYLFCKYSSLR